MPCAELYRNHLCWDQLLQDSLSGVDLLSLCTGSPRRFSFRTAGIPNTSQQGTHRGQRDAQGEQSKLRRATTGARTQSNHNRQPNELSHNEGKMLLSLPVWKAKSKVLLYLKSVHSWCWTTQVPWSCHKLSKLSKQLTSTSESLRKAPDVLSLVFLSVYVSVVRVWHFNLTVASLLWGGPQKHTCPQAGKSCFGWWLPLYFCSLIPFELHPKRISTSTTAGILNTFWFTTHMLIWLLSPQLR